MVVDAGYSQTLHGSVTELSGDILLRKGSRLARSQQARFDHVNERAELSGLVQFREPGILLLGDKAEIDLNRNLANIENAQFVFHSRHLRGTAERIQRLNDNELVIHQGAYTRCEPGNNTWSINGSKIVLHQDEGLGEVQHATLRLSNVPVVYVPYLTFPIDNRRMSGLLFPKFSLTSDNGFDYAPTLLF